MNDKIASAKTFVKKHKTAIALTTGVAVGATATYLTKIHGRTLLEVTEGTAAYMKRTGNPTFYHREKLGHFTVMIYDKSHLPDFH